MNYIVIEAQTTNGTTATIVNTYADYPHAEQKYHLVLSAAAVSDVPLHAAAMLTERGNLVKYECYDHTPEPEEETPEEETEPTEEENPNEAE